MASAEKLPVLKMPAKLALPGLRILARNRTADERRKLLAALNPNIPERTLLNAYMLPSLAELRLYSGTLKAGDVTRYGKTIAESKDPKAYALIARRLIEMDAERIGFVDWLAEFSGRGQRKRAALRNFVNERLGLPEASVRAALDRLGKWSNYLIFFGVMRESHTTKGVTWVINRRQVGALSAVTPDAQTNSLPSSEEQSDALLSAYARASQQLGSRLYLPITAVRDELGRELERYSGELTDTEVDEVLRRAPGLLERHIVSFSPFSGPARGGLQLENMYAGFISIRSRPTTDDVPQSKHEGEP